MKYSTSITQNRPVPSFVVFGAADRAEDLLRAQQIAGPDRLVEHDGVVGHHCLGQAEAFLQVEMHLQGQGLFGAVGRPMVGPEPHRQHRRRRDRPVGDRRGRVGVPEQRIAVLDRGAAGPDVALLHGELAALLVLHDADQFGDVGRQIVDDGHPTAPSCCNDAISSAR